MEDQKENNLPCECENWCSDGRPPILSHKWSCNKYRPISEMLEIITGLVKGIQDWSADEDGVHPGCWAAYSRAKLCIGEYDHIKKQIIEERGLELRTTHSLTATADSQPARKPQEQNIIEPAAS